MAEGGGGGGGVGGGQPGSLANPKKMKEGVGGRREEKGCRNDDSHIEQAPHVSDSTFYPLLNSMLSCVCVDENVPPQSGRRYFPGSNLYTCINKHRFLVSWRVFASQTNECLSMFLFPGGL